MSADGSGRIDPEDRVWLSLAQAQDLRIRRLSLAICVSCGVVFTVLAMPSAGLIRTELAMLGAGIVALTCVVFSVIFGLGWNRRFRDPSLTRAMTLAALFDTTLISCLANDQGRMLVWAMLPGVFVFASFRFGLRRLTGLALAAISMMAGSGLIGTMLWANPARWRLMLVQMMAVTVSLAALTLVGGHANDLRRRTRSERAMSHTVMTRLEDAVVLVDTDLCVKYCNPGARALFGSVVDAHPGMGIGRLCRMADGRDLVALLGEVGRAAATGPGAVTPAGPGAVAMPVRSAARAPRPGPGEPAALLADGERMASLRGEATAVSLNLESASGGVRQVELTVSPLHSERGIPEGQVLLFRDVTETRRLLADLHHAATHDEVTGLLNRRGFLECLAAMAGEPGGPGQETCVLAIDLDQFKVVNDACGHKAGDELLLRIASMMIAVAPAGTCVGRLGGDEFGMALAHCPVGRAEALGRRLVTDVARLRFHHGGQYFKVGASIGLVQSMAGMHSAEELLTRADSACFLAKERGRNRLQIYQAGDESVARHRTDVNWVTRINDALDEHRLVLFGQRIERARKDSPLQPSVEALIRIADGAGRLVMPGSFLPAAERFDLIAAIDRRVIAMVVQAMIEAEAGGIVLPGVSINLSASSLRDPDLLGWIADAIERSRLPSELFTFELTESAAIVDLDQARIFFAGIRALGARVALDDVGAGFNSFANLRRLPLDRLKIDGSYVRSVCDSPVDQAFVESMQRIAELLGIETVAEFVENASIRTRIEEIGIDYLQGYGVHMPEPFMQALEGRDSVQLPAAGQQCGL